MRRVRRTKERKKKNTDLERQLIPILIQSVKRLSSNINYQRQEQKKKILIIIEWKESILIGREWCKYPGLRISPSVQRRHLYIYIRCIIIVDEQSLSIRRNKRRKNEKRLFWSQPLSKDCLWTLTRYASIQIIIPIDKVKQPDRVKRTFVTTTEERRKSRKLPSSQSASQSVRV